MNDAMTFSLAGEPVSWKRVRATLKGQPRFFVDHETRKQKQRVAAAAKAAVGGKELHLWRDKPVRLSCVFVFSIPKSWPKWKQAAALDGGPCTNVKDVDNLVKLVKDALNDVVWNDDRQVVEMHVRKRYGAEPMTSVLIEALPVPERP